MDFLSILLIIISSFSFVHLYIYLKNINKNNYSFIYYIVLSWYSHLIKVIWFWNKFSIYK